MRIGNVALLKQQKQSDVSVSVSYCGVCRAEYGDCDDPEFWIRCGKCDSWFHGDCVSITLENEPEEFYCSACV